VLKTLFMDKTRKRNSCHRNQKEQTPHKRIKMKVFNRKREEVSYKDEDWVPLSEWLKSGED
jgi:hypothetical protein